MTTLIKKAEDTPHLCGLILNFMATVFFAIVMLHLLAGFGYVMYRLSGPGTQEKDAGGH